MKQWIESKWDDTFFDLKLRVQDSMQRFLFISERIVNFKKPEGYKDIEVRNIYIDDFEDISVELYRLWSEIMDIEYSKKQEIFIMINYYIKNLPCILKGYAIERLALNVLWEIFNCTDKVRNVFYVSNTKKGS